jgi:hypothetical protein
MKSIAIVLKQNLPRGLSGNICACLATGVAALDPGILGEDIRAPDVVYKAITRIPILILEERNGMEEIRARAEKNGLEFVMYDKLAAGASDYDQYAKDILATASGARDILGIAVTGDRERVKKVIGDLPLVK